MNNIYYDCRNQTIIADAFFFANKDQLKKKIENKKFIISVNATPEYLESLIKEGYYLENIYSKHMVCMSPAYISSVDGENTFLCYPELQSPFSMIKSKSRLNLSRKAKDKLALRLVDGYRPIPVCDIVVRNEPTHFFGTNDQNITAYLRSKLVYLNVLGYFMHASPDAYKAVLKAIHSDPLEWNNAIQAVKAIENKTYPTFFKETKEVQIKLKSLENDSIGKFLFHKALANVLNKGETVINSWNLRFIHNYLLKFCKETQVKSIHAMNELDPYEWLGTTEDSLMNLLKLLILKSLFGDFDMRVCYDILAHYVPARVLGDKHALIKLGQVKFQKNFDTASLNRIFKTFSELYENSDLRRERNPFGNHKIKSVVLGGSNPGPGYIISAYASSYDSSSSTMAAQASTHVTYNGAIAASLAGSSPELKDIKSRLEFQAVVEKYKHPNKENVGTKEPFLEPFLEPFVV